MTQFFRIFPMMAGDFDVMNENRGPGVYYTLWQKISETGAGAYYLERHAGVWLILIAIMLLGLSYAFRSKTIQERLHLKEKTVTTIVVIALFFALSGLITSVIQAGFDN